MKKLFTILSAALLSVSAFAELAYNTTLSENDFNNSATVIAKNNASWNNGIYMTKGGFNWDEYSATVALAAGVPNKLSFTCQQSSFASTGTGFVVYESADNTNWTEAKKPGLSGASAQSYSADLKATTRYLKFAWAGNFSGTYTNIKVTEKILMGTPNPESIDFGTVKVDDVVEGQTFTLGWTNLTGTATSSDSHFTVTPDTFGEIGANLQTTTFTVGLLTSEAGVYSGTITLAGRGKSAQVAVSGTVEKYNQTINWDPAESVDFGGAIAVATATSGLDVTYEIANPNVLKFENGAFVTLYAGTTQVTAKQAGNYKYNAAANVVKNITVVAPTTYGDFVESSCDTPVEFHNVSYTESFAGDVNVGKNYMGGDSIVHVAITIKHATFGEDTKTIVLGAQESWNGIDLSTYGLGTHDVPFETTNVAGCDSTVTLHLTVIKSDAVERDVELEFCQGGSVEYRDRTYTAAGTDVINVTGDERDTVINVTIIELLPSESNEELSINVGAEEEWNGIDLSTYAVGTYELNYTTANAAGCDSVITLALTVEKLQAVKENRELEFCEGDSVEYRGVWYNAAGEDSYQIEGATRDTLVVVTIAVNPNAYAKLEQTVLSGHEIVLPEGEWLIGEETVSGTYPTVKSAVATTLTFFQYGQTEKGCEDVKELVVTVESNTEAVDNIFVGEKAEKVFRNGVLYIRRGERIFTCEGREVK
jgi:hypothetical protein